VKYTTKVEKPKVLKTFSSITKNLSRTYTKFKFSEIEESAKSGKYLSSVDWLIASNILTPCYNLTQLSTPLSANKIDSEFKLYFNDIGLLIANYGDVTLQEQIFNDKIGDAKGGIYENVLGCILRSMGYKLFYFKKFESTKDKQFEIDFIINDANYIYTIEMKSTNSKSKSLSKVLELTNKKNIKGFKLVSGNVGTGKDFDVIPFYFSIFLP
jgi:predicted AAA+ superfamily ATPase